MNVRQVDEEHRLKVMRLIAVDPTMTQRDLAEALGVSVGKMNYCLRALGEKGLIKIQNFTNSKQKLAYAYLLTPSGLAHKAELTRHFLRAKMDEYESLRTEIAELQREVEQQGAMTSHLTAPATATNSPQP